MKTDVFLRIYARGYLRSAMAVTAVARWSMEEDIDLWPLVGHIDDTLLDEALFNLSHQRRVKVDPDFFQARARRFAEEHTRSDVYCVADDDQLIIGERWVQRGVETLLRHPEYGILSGWSITGEVPEGQGTDEVWEVPSSVGCPYFIRRGTISIVSLAELGQEDTVFCTAVHAKCLKVGFIRGLRYNHIGAHFSTTSPEHWNRI